MAQILNDETICDLTGDDSGICNGDIAIQKKDAGVCERILDEYFRNTCYLIFNEYKRDISICDNKIKNPIDRDSCYIGLLYSSFKMGKQIPPTGKQFCEKIVNRDTYNICVGAYNDFYSDR